MSFWSVWKYKNLTLWFTSILIVALLFRNDQFHLFLIRLGTLGYFGAFIAGILFVSTFTVAIGVLILLILAGSLTPWEIGTIAGLGAVVGDFLIFRFVKNNLVEEIADIYRDFGGKHISKLLHTRYFSWTLPVIGALIIASPLPDELGVSLMGIARMKSYKFLLISFLLNAFGIFLVVSASLVFY